MADINGDGQADLLTANPGDPAIVVLLGNGNGTFQPRSRYVTSSDNAPSGLAVADINGDGRPDVLTANAGGTVGVLLNTSAVLSSRAALPGTTTTLYPNPTASAATLNLAGLPASVAQVRATLLDATGRLVCQQLLPASQGNAHTEVTTASLAVGLYILRLTAYDGQGEQVGSLSPQRLSVH